MARNGVKDGTSGGSAPAPAIDFAQMLGIADALPMALAFVDTELRYRFVNQALADFVELPRSEMLGRTMGEILDPKVMADRREMLDAALAGERVWFAADYDHPRRGKLAIQSEYLPQFAPDGSVYGLMLLISDVTEQRVAERALSGERGAVPADRGFGAGTDVGHTARPQPRLRQPGLC